MTLQTTDSYDSMSIIARQPTWLETQTFHMENQLNPNFCQGFEPEPQSFFVKDKSHFSIKNIQRKPRNIEQPNLQERTPYNLFLDDYRTPSNVVGYAHTIGLRADLYIKHKWDIAIDYNHFVEIIEAKGLPVIVSLDHDLADCHYVGDFSDPNEKTGMDCAKWLIDYCVDNNKQLPEYYVHSMNPVGRKNIQSLLDNYKKYERGN